MKRKITHFTLVEILAVIAIIGILAGATFGIGSYVKNRNREVQTETTIKMIEVVLEQYKNKYGSYPALTEPKKEIGQAVFRLPANPAEGDKLVALFDDISYNGSEITGIKGVNIVRKGNDIIFLDGWGSPIIYVYPGVFNKTKFDLGSGGANKLLGDDEGSKFSATDIPACGNRNDANGAYRKHFGTGDDITNFRR
ncbi:MAG: prepilin-type N-terminal cleavage/methylation domain-containing protein [Lentisphaerae bacterium]|nr:prepilin-type N-terminal cleavage/methylation domain-containing protein [Lentisphaerota bacterium]